MCLCVYVSECLWVCVYEYGCVRVLVRVTYGSCVCGVLSDECFVVASCRVLSKWPSTDYKGDLNIVSSIQSIPTIENSASKVLLFLLASASVDANACTVSSVKL